MQFIINVATVTETANNLKNTLLAGVGVGSGSGAVVSTDTLLSALGAVVGVVSIVMLVLNYFEARKQNRLQKDANKIADRANNIAISRRKGKK